MCAAGVPFQVVPGVTSAIGVPAYAGIPVTHRGITQDFSVVSAHLDPSQPGATVDWEALARSTGTLVLLMAVAHLDAVAAELVKRGRDAATPGRRHQRRDDAAAAGADLDARAGSGGR